MISLISKHATAKLKGNTLVCRGTDTKQIGDILADILLLVPYYIKGVGFVSYSVYLQAREIYDRHLSELLKHDLVVLSGHSLGAGICRVLAIMLIDDFELRVSIVGKGGVGFHRLEADANRCDEILAADCVDDVQQLACINHHLHLTLHDIV